MAMTGRSQRNSNQTPTTITTTTTTRTTTTTYQQQQRLIKVGGSEISHEFTYGAKKLHRFVLNRIVNLAKNNN